MKMDFSFIQGNPIPGKAGGGELPEESGFETLDLADGLDRPIVATFPPFDTEHAYPSQAIIFSEIPNLKKFAETQIGEIIHAGRKNRSLIKFLRPRRRRKGRFGKVVSRREKNRARPVVKKHRARSNLRRKSPQRPSRRRPKGLFSQLLRKPLHKPLRKPLRKPPPRPRGLSRKRQPRRNPFHRARPRSVSYPVLFPLPLPMQGLR